jgi:RNA polymerase sigma factor (sigma-70 family)
MKLSELYRLHQKNLERYLQRFIGNGDDAKEISQEAFLRAYASELGQATPLSQALLYTVAKNLALTELRKRTFRATDSMGDLSELEIYDVSESPDLLIQQKQMLAAIEVAMTRMSPKCLEVFRLRKIEDASHESIANQLNISTKTVERHITRALQLCHEALLEKTTKTDSSSKVISTERKQS